MPKCMVTYSGCVHLAEDILSDFPQLGEMALHLWSEIIFWEIEDDKLVRKQLGLLHRMFQRIG